ncbi:MAG: hypothetical protein K6C36_10355 [Clostridia bacterium]|nr:hypothetical protein [Clostridia bacterium]
MEKIRRDASGVYRWVYEMSLLSNPWIFVLTAKVIFGVTAGVWLFISIITCIEDGSLSGFVTQLPLLGIIGGIMAGLLVIGYLIYAAIMGGKYIVEFTMDEKVLVHRQVESQAKKAKKIGEATVIVGALAGNPTTVGIGLTHGGRNTSTTEFCRLRKVVLRRRRGVIKLIGGGHNEAYADGEDFDFLVDFIRSHAPEGVVWKGK